MNTTSVHRPWMGLVALVLTCLVGSAFSRPSVNTVERERLLQSAAAAIDNLPPTIGAWHSTAGVPLSDDLLHALGCRAYQSRTYTNERSGERVSLLLLAGDARPLAALPPNACYEGEQFTLAESGKSAAIGNGDELLQVTLQSGAQAGTVVTTYLAWRKPRGRWEAPKNPSLALGAQPMLYRLQVATDAGAKPPGDPAAPDACRSFLNDLLPAIDDLLISN